LLDGLSDTRSDYTSQEQGPSGSDPALVLGSGSASRFTANGPGTVPHRDVFEAQPIHDSSSVSGSSSKPGSSSVSSSTSVKGRNSDSRSASSDPFFSADN